MGDKIKVLDNGVRWVSVEDALPTSDDATMYDCVLTYHIAPCGPVFEFCECDNVHLTEATHWLKGLKATNNK